MPFKAGGERRLNHRIIFGSICTALFALICSPLFAQEGLTPQEAAALAPIRAAALNIKFRERPRYPVDSQRLRRTPSIDGVLGEGEWDPFYTIDQGNIRGTFYVNWDDENLYIAAKTDQPSLLIFDLDLNGDGWLRGADNLEIVVGSIVNNSALSVDTRILDAQTDRDAPTWRPNGVDYKSLRVAQKLNAGGQFTEVAIPRNAVGVSFRAGGQLGLRAEFLPAGPASAYLPTAPYDPHLLLEATLVDSHGVAVAGIQPTLTISDKNVVGGQKLFATLQLYNQTGRDVPIRSVFWSGQGGRNSEAVNSMREVALKPVPARKKTKYGYKTLIPENLPVGTYTIQVVAELEDGKELRSSVVFNVVEPITVRVSSAPQPVLLSGTTPVTIQVEVANFVPGGTNPEVILSKYPTTWNLKGNPSRRARTEKQNTARNINYVLQLPFDTANGTYPLEILVRNGNREWRNVHAVRIQRLEGTAPTRP